jgi:outer membrane murein-binding lipoprotein Lpp
MVRFFVLTGLTLAQLVLSGCSNRQQVDLTQWRDYRATTAASAKPSQVRSPQAMISHATEAHAEVESVGTVGRSTGTIDGPKHLRPWPKKGTPEFEQLQAEEIEQENRAKAAIHSICRGC